MSMPQPNDTNEKISKIMGELEKTGISASDAYSIHINGWEITVLDVKTSELVGYSFAKGDFENSLAEFIGDFMV